MLSEPNITLTIAVICKNEGKNIDRCLKSIYKSIKHIKNVEVLVADSFSTDDTIEIASRYPLKIIQLRENWPHSPAAGRYMAFLHARGAYTMCIDADMELIDGYLQIALAFMEACPQAAGVTGTIKHTMLSNTEHEYLNVDGGELFSLERKRLDGNTQGLLKSIPGSGVFRTKAVLDVGNFHPFLRAEEEYELCQRLRKEGHELWYLPYRIVEHHGYSGNGWDEIKRRWKRGFMKGIGEMFKLSFMNDFVIENFIRFHQHLIFGGYILLAPFCLMLGFIYIIFPLLWITGLVMIIVIYCIKKRNLRESIYAAINKALIGICIYAMFLSRIPSSSSYPVDPIIIDLSAR